MSKDIGVGILGYSIGRAHAHAWRNVSEVYHPLELVPKLVAISGRTKDVVDFEAKKYGYEKAYYDWEKVVRDEDVEIVDN
jgi:predicted dehydrogenase